MLSALLIALQTTQPRTNMLPFILQFGAIILIFWFLLIRPQRRMAQKHQELLSKLERGNEVMTEGGVIGEIVHIKDDRVTIRTAESTRLVVARAKIARVLTGETGQTETK